MIYLIGEAPECPFYKQATFEEFLGWVSVQTQYELDIETTVTPFWSTKKVITVQFGSSTEDLQWVLQVSRLTQEEITLLIGVLERKDQLKLAHNAAFEVIVLRFFGAKITNIYDTMLMEKVLTSGTYEDEEGYGLADLVYNYIGLTLDKTEQTEFGDDILTVSKVLYAAEDVKHLSAIRRMQIPLLQAADLDWVAALENEALMAYCEITYEGMDLDTAAWRANIELAQPLVEAAVQRLNSWLTGDDCDLLLRDQAMALGYISDRDRIQFKWSSPKQRGELLQLLYPDLPGASKGVIKKYIKDQWEPVKHSEEAVQEVIKKNQLLIDYYEGRFSSCEQVLVALHRDDLIRMGILIPAETVTINWNSVVQVLPLLQIVEPKLKDMSAESFGRTTHPIIQDIEEFKDNLKLLSSYGEKFIEKFLEPDGRVRTSFNQVVSTGRVSSKKPNMQQVPAKEAVGNRYRNCFIAPPDWVYVDSDFSSQELCMIAHYSKDPVWNDALRKGQDLHSVCAELVFGRQWKEAAEADCTYYNTFVDKSGKVWPANSKQKCSCKKHKVMRQGVKTINFGLAYGMSAFKLSSTLRISKKEAEALIEEYFRAFPGIESLLEKLGRFGVLYGYSRTPAPFYRKRFYPLWKHFKQYIKAHVTGVEYHPSLGAIERQSKNHPIQGGSADMVKLASVLIYWYIQDNGLQDRVKIVQQVHDQVTTIAHKDYAETWKVEMTELMEAAARVFIPTGLLKSETNITEKWSK